METTRNAMSSLPPQRSLRLIGPLALCRDGVALQLPPSRKLRALLAYLSLAPHPVLRERLCTLLWDVPNDPRGELRWCLSKLRALLDDPSRLRVRTAADHVWLDLDGCEVDTARLLDAARTGLDRLDLAALQALAASCDGDFLEGVVFDHHVEFEHWLAGRRSEFRSLHIDVLAEAARRMPAGTAEGLSAARRWLDLAPCDPRGHERFLLELLHRGMVEDCARHLERNEKVFLQEGVDFAPVRQAWDRIRQMRPVPAAPRTDTPVVSPPPPPQTVGPRRASIAVMPFRELRDGASEPSELGNAVAHDIISRLARLRSLFIISRGSVFALAGEQLDVQEIGRRLNVDYVATGFVERRPGVVLVAAEIAEAATSRIIWTERLEAGTGRHLDFLDEIGNGIVSSIAAEIENAERNRALLKPPDSLDAWEAYHRGLWHMYRFTAEENARAAAFFRRSVALDPTFSRAYAGLSFTHWQSAFQRWGDRSVEARQALETAGHSLLVDDQNPAAHWSMGRALWLMDEHEAAVRELERSVDLSPNFALGHYALAFVHCQTGDPALAIASSDHSRLLSPYDPLLFGMLGTRALALVRLGAFQEAAGWAVKAAARPNAHVHILAIAAHCLALAGRIEEARAHVARIRRQNPHYRGDDLLDTFHFAADEKARYRGAASLIGLAG
ncbi:DNA-binding SARP family transcriptional activator/TolB-like protein [Ancylobacter sp. 3268]|uniref:transcriptional regulator n=1 Tax=Ancylobacter sp. 3268 TaxID=2817752 RepID=UPI00286160DA|nr:transcriptional regulator [Ancylobacter sp. 3268]MDR6950929.1 DNA-binding SARP family transcriptional activator/TolB-like protein [Ancylobacter sp. 3268]